MPSYRSDQMWSSQLIRGMPQSDPCFPHEDKLFLFLKFCSSVLYTLFISLFVSFRVYWKQTSLRIQAVMNAVLFWSALCMTVMCARRGGVAFGSERDPFWSLKIDWRESFWHSGWHCTFWALEWDQVCGSTKGRTATDTTAASKQTIFPPLSKPSNNIHFFKQTVFK